MDNETESRFKEHQARVYGWAYRFLQNHDDALDVSQEVSIKWWQANGNGRPPANPAAWLRRVTVNLAIDAIRARNQKTHQSQGGQLEPSVPSHLGELAKQETARQIVAALEFLTERQRSVVVAKIYDGCTFAEIADQMGLSPPTVKSHYLRALRTLRTKLAYLQKEPGADHEL